MKDDARADRWPVENHKELLRCLARGPKWFEELVDDIIARNGLRRLVQ